MKKIVFYLMNEKGLVSLKSFLKEFEANAIEYVVLSRDASVVKDFYDELKDLCDNNGIQTYQKNDKLHRFPGYKFAIGWRWLIEDVSNLIVFHDSILPQYRGFSPLVNMLINGEREIGVTALFASDEYDKGDIIAQVRAGIEYPIKINDAIKISTKLYSELVIQLSELVIYSKPIIGDPQIESEASYSIWRDEKDYAIDWNKCSETIQRTVNSLGFPYNGATTTLNGEPVLIHHVDIVSEIKIENRDSGKVIFIQDGYPVVICGQGLLKIIEATDVEGKSILPLKKFRSRFGG